MLRWELLLSGLLKCRTASHTHRMPHGFNWHKNDRGMYRCELCVDGEVAAHFDPNAPTDLTDLARQPSLAGNRGKH